MSLINRIDHLVVPVDDPEDLFDLFTQRLGLPALWPVTDVGSFHSAGVAAGNCWIEIVAGATSLTPLYEAHLPAVFRGIAFDTNGSCEDAAATLTAEGVSLGELRRVEGRRPDGATGPLVTIAPVPGLIGDAGIAYLCEMAVPVDGQRVADRTAKAAARDDSIGIRAITDVHIGTRNLAPANDRWSRLAEKADDGRWRLGDGPAVRVTESPIEGISGITVTVDSLTRAIEVLRERKLLGAVRDTGAGINHSAAHGLDIWLTETGARPAGPPVKIDATG